MNGLSLPREWAAVVSELKKRPRPRSPSFTMPVAVMNTLAGLMSAREGAGGGCGVCGEAAWWRGEGGGGLGVCLSPDILKHWFKFPGLNAVT